MTALLNQRHRTSNTSNTIDPVEGPLREIVLQIIFLGDCLKSQSIIEYRAHCSLILLVKKLESALSFAFAIYTLRLQIHLFMGFILEINA